MNAASFYEHFESGFAPVLEALPALKRLAGKTSKWRLRLETGSINFSFATNFKSAGLLPHMPGEFRLTADWTHDVEGKPRKDSVSLFQYTTDDECRQFATLQRAALEKFLRQPGKEPLRAIYPYANEPEWLPRANFDEWCIYFDEDDAAAWGEWYRQILPPWVERFSASPESQDAWAWRVLWPHLKKKQEANEG